MNRFLRLRKFYDWFNNFSYLNITTVRLFDLENVITI